MMPRLLWLTDIHLNFVKSDRIRRLFDEVRTHAPDIVLIGGDIGEADSFANYLQDLAGQLRLPIYFVLGNHDYYRGSIASVRESARSLSRESEFLYWLPDVGAFRLTDQSVLLGHGGWGDGRCGDFLKSDVVLNDYLLIEELRRAAVAEGGLLDPGRTVPPLPQSLLTRLNALGDNAAEHVRAMLPRAAHEAAHIWFLTHVPPFREACWHQGRLSDNNWLPHFACQAVGDVLRDFMRQHAQHRMTVLCGHTHGEGFVEVLPNLEVFTGGATYGQPSAQRVFEVN